jgi:non-ribosomal peptide synthetase-like protein
MLLHELFAATVDAHPERVAIDVPPANGRRLRATTTFRELAAMAAALQRQLGEVPREGFVVILLPRDSAWVYAAQLAVLAAGGAHVCLDPVFPDRHLSHVLSDTAAAAVITDAAGARRLSAGGVPPATRIVQLPLSGIVAGDGDGGGGGDGDGNAAPMPRVTDVAARLAYAIYTSGTTGLPKAVLLEHAGLVNLIQRGVERFAIAPGDRIAQGSSCAYDSSLEETWLALASGACVVVLDDETVRLGPDLVPWLLRERITVFCPPPTLLRAMNVADPRRELPALRLCYVGGEPLPTDLAALWGGALWLENGYGPTECTVTVSRGRVLPGQPVTIGTPVPPHRALVLDGELREVALGEAGELCIQGPGLARGYLGQPELTVQRFPTLPEHGRVYRTGDLVVQRADGELLYHGRIDAQVKLRGYRIELEAIEAVLAGCPGVREVVCAVQGEEPARQLVAFVVPAEREHAVDIASLADAVRTSLPAYMVPARFATLASLPRSIGGKIDRKALPRLAEAEVRPAAAAWQPDGAAAIALRDAIAHVLRLPPGAIGADSDFFTLGGDSLRAAMLVSRLRPQDGFAAFAVRDVYAAPTPLSLLQRLRERRPAAPAAAAVGIPRVAGEPRPMLVTAGQVAFLSGLLLLVAGAAWAGAFVLVPALLAAVALPILLLALPWLWSLLRVLHATVTLVAAVAAKQLLIGSYRRGRVPVWTAFYLRHWLVVRCVRLVPWSLLEGTELKNQALRWLGARIGARVHIHSGVDVLSGGWDLLDIGDDVSVLREAHIGLCELDAGDLVVGPVRIDRGATLATRSSVGPDSHVGAGAMVAALACVRGGTSVPPGELWDCVPAVPVGRVPPPAAVDVGGRAMSSGRYATSLLLTRLLLQPALALPAVAVAWLFLQLLGIDGARLAAWLLAGEPWQQAAWCQAVIAAAAIAVPVRLWLDAALLRWSQHVPAGTHALGSLTHLRCQARMEVLHKAGGWLAGTLMWPKWLRLAGMRVGRDCEISTILDVLPEHTSIGDGSFLADGIYLGVPRIHGGACTVGPTSLGARSFVGNHVVVPAGERLPDDLLLGVSTVAAATMPAGTGWFGQPAFALPRREIVSIDRRLTHDPGLARRLGRWFWELARFAMPVLPAVLVFAWLEHVGQAHAAGPWVGFAAAVVATLAYGAILAAAVLALKWLLLGRVRPGQHGLWSCWAQRWDFHYVVWERWGRALLQPLEGTLLLPWYLRAMGMRIGRRCVLGDGFAQVVDPDMLTIEDGSTVHAFFQAHSFEDRVLKMGRVRIGRRASVGCGTVVLYGADIGDGAHVLSNSVVMKHELLLPGQRYAGAPTVLVT